MFYNIFHNLLPTGWEYIVFDSGIYQILYLYLGHYYIFLTHYELCACSLMMAARISRNMLEQLLYSSTIVGRNWLYTANFIKMQ